MDISFVIPCYCSEKNLESVIDEIRSAMQLREAFEYEIILVNDNSKDHTADLIKKLADEDAHIQGINFAKNFGQPSALMAGFRAAKGDYIMTSDDDGQTPVEMVWDFYDKMQEGYDIVCAKYTERTQSAFRKLGTKVNELMLYYMVHKPKDVGVASFFMAKRFVIEEMTRDKGPDPYIAGLLLRSSGRIANLEMKQRDRKSGSSGYNFKKLITLWVNGFTAFSVIPLRLSFVLGTVSAALGSLVLVFSMIRKLFKPIRKESHTSLTGLILMMSGCIMAMIGIVGEYVGRIYMSVNEQPQYVIRNTTEDDK